MEPDLFKFLKNDHTILERRPLENIAKKKQLAAFKHEGFWQCMDTKKDKDVLNKILSKRKKF
jgi:glucose-1-phosphate cytidylyltransferase